MGSRAGTVLLVLSFALLSACGPAASVAGRHTSGARGIVAAPALGAAAAPAERLPVAEPVWAAETTKPVVALTFDDGPDPRWTPSILKTLASKHVKATFFVLGSSVRRHPELVLRERRSGDQIACHGWTHQVQLGWSRTRVLRAFEACAAIVKRTAGVRPEFVRSPYGLLRSDQVAYLDRSRFTVVDWNMSVSSSVARPILLTAQVARIRSGTIVLLHDGRGDRSGVIRLLPSLIDGLRARGFQMVTLSELLSGGAGRSLEPASAECWRVHTYVAGGFLPRAVLADVACAKEPHPRAA